MTTFTVKNIPPSLYSLLKQAAEMHHRSINSEIIVCIEKAVRSQRVALPTLLARAREIRRQTQDAGLTEDEIQQAKLAGRL
jgi:plasmid stability protein